jgi:flagellar biosynthesis/type III secretory pathway protein FliH
MEEAGVRSVLVAGILIVAVFVYLIAASRLDAPPGEPSGVAKYQAMTEYVRSLEKTRRKLMVAAALKSESYSRPRKVNTAGGVRGAYAQGYREGFEEGYATGSYLSASARPNALFFPIPKPN